MNPFRQLYDQSYIFFPLSRVNMQPCHLFSVVQIEKISSLFHLNSAQPVVTHIDFMYNNVWLYYVSEHVL